MRAFLRLFTNFCALSVALLVSPVAARAQDPPESAAPPSHISYVDGSAVVSHVNGEREDAVVNLPVVAGDRIRTLAASHVEVMFPDGGSIAIDPDSDVEFITETRARVVAGAIEHRAAPPMDPRSPSTQNLPPDLQPYAPDLDRNGAWQYEPQYGNVWYPTTVSADWRPYYDGYWSSFPEYGWTWIGYERWAWPTHHYGRWGYARSRWFWIPGRSFAAAWVSWGTAADYISWCPLGWDGRPVVALSVAFRSSWNPWTIVPRDRFGVRGYSARRYGVDAYRVGSTAAFIEHRNPPARDRRGSFGIAGRSGRSGAESNIDRRTYGGTTYSGAGRAVPRGEYRNAPGDYRSLSGESRNAPGEFRRRVPGPLQRDAPAMRAPGSAVAVAPGDERSVRRDAAPGTVPGRRAEPGLAPSTGDHPAYRPQYQPRYEPAYQPPQRAEPGFQRGPAVQDRRMHGGDTRAVVPERAEPRRAAEPRPQMRANPPPRSEGAPARVDRGGGPPAREPHNSRGEGRSAGSAGRRPR